MVRLTSLMLENLPHSNSSCSSDYYLNTIGQLKAQRGEAFYKKRQKTCASGSFMRGARRALLVGGSWGRATSCQTAEYADLLVIFFGSNFTESTTGIQIKFSLYQVVSNTIS